MATFLYRLGRFSFRRRRLVTLLWVGLLVLFGVGAAVLKGPTSNDFSMPGTESQQAIDLLKDRMPQASADGATARVVFAAPDGKTVTDPAGKAGVEKVVAKLKAAPQVASVGLTEQAAKERKLDIRVGRFPFIGNGKAIALGEDQGLVKVIFDRKTGQLLGAHMVGAEVTELIQGYVVAMNLETTEEELMHTVFPHPTLSEMMKEAVLDAYGRVLNM